MGRLRRRSQDSPIDSKQKALAEQEEKLRREMRELQQIIEEAPEVAREVEKRRRQDLVIRASQPIRPAESPNSLFDKRYDVTTTPRRPTKSLRAEKHEARLKFLMLCAVLIVCLMLIYVKILH
jgi:hypothetical protein